MPKSTGGFASLSPEKRSEYGRKGALMAHKLGKAHRFTPEEAAIAGRKGGSMRGSSKQGEPLTDPPLHWRTEYNGESMQELRDQGLSYRNIAYLFGIDHPQKVKWYLDKEKE